jgi:hypothetical protein
MICSELPPAIREHCLSVGNDRLTRRNSVVDSFRLRLFEVEPDIGVERMARSCRPIDNSSALRDVMKQAVGGLHRGILSCKDNTLLTVGFSLRTKQEQTLKSHRDDT